MITAAPFMSTVGQAFAEAIRSAQVEPARGHLQFFQDELVIPSGKYQGMPFTPSVQPYTGLLLAELDNERWNEIVITGPSQSGKTTCGFTGPAIYVAAELAESVVIGLPDLVMAGDKWEIDIAPILRASPTLRSLIPSKGPGSRGGKITDSIKLTNGATIKFMTKGGSDQSKAGFPGCRFLRITEAAGFSHSSETSAEADPFRQIKARLASYDLEETQTIIEGTVTLEEELPWSLRERSTKSRIACPCPHCGGWITPEREHFTGWETAKNEYEAADNGAFYCPDCGEKIDDEQRYESNRLAVLLHDGQEIDAEGNITGEAPKTSRLWFRWSAFNNCMISSRTFAVREWEAAQIEEETEDRRSAEKSLCQFTWSTPYQPPNLDDTPLTVTSVRRRVDGFPRGQLPSDTRFLTVAFDPGKWTAWWLAIAFRENGQLHVPAYGQVDVVTEASQDVEIRLAAALNEFKEQVIEPGFIVQGSSESRVANSVWIDGGYQPDIVYEFCRQAGRLYHPCFGRGESMINTSKYVPPRKRAGDIKLIGKRLHIHYNKGQRLFSATFDADFWKVYVQERLSTAQGKRGSLEFYAATGREHHKLARHLTNEKLKREFVPGKGVRQWWEKSGQNHWLDCAAQACAAGSVLGFDLADQRPPQQSQQNQRAVEAVEIGGGRGFVSTR